MDKSIRTVIQTTVSHHPEFGRFVAHVHLQTDSVEIIDPTGTHKLSPADRTQILHSAQAWQRVSPRPYPRDIRWYEEETVFDTFWESWEWVSSDIYNQMSGNLYDGYRTADEKMACALVYQLTQLNTIADPAFQVFTRRESDGGRSYFRVWVERTRGLLPGL